MKMKEYNTGKLKEITKKLLPVSSLILLTLLLMFFFRQKKQDIGRFFEKGKDNLVAFYSQNLKPLFTTTEITNEDVFNFALYNSLPIDKNSNRVLTVSKQGDDNQVFEIKPVLYNTETKNYEKFVNYLGLNPKQREEADSILNLYKKQLYLSVLMDKNNTVAVSSKINELQKAALADILNFAGKINAQKAWNIFPVQPGWENDVENFIVSAKNDKQNEFLFITPDTAFKTICTIDPDELNKAVEQKIKQSEISKQWSANSTAGWNFDFHFSQETNKTKSAGKESIKHDIRIQHPDSNSFKVVIPFPEIPDVPLLNDSIRIKLDEAAKKLRQLSILFDGKEHSKFLGRNLKDSKSKDAVQFNFEDPTEIINKTMQFISKEDFKDWEEFGERIDSIANEFGNNYKDSILKKYKSATDVNRKLKKPKPRTPAAPKTPDIVN